MKTDQDWMGRSVDLAESANGVRAFANVFDGCIRGGVAPWPPPELVQKLYQSTHSRAYRDENFERATAQLGYYSDLQSVHSEDIVTWNLFGPLCYGSPQARSRFAQRLLSDLDGSPAPEVPATIWLWRRLPHPDNLSPGGPEIDFGIQTETRLVLGEAKWRSGVASSQGVARNKDQVDLRTEFCEKYGSRIFSNVRHFTTILVAPRSQDIASRRIVEGTARIDVASRTWAELGQLLGEESGDEFLKQLAWRESRSQSL